MMVRFSGSLFKVEGTRESDFTEDETNTGGGEKRENYIDCKIQGEM